MTMYWQGGGLKSLFLTGGVEMNFPFVDYVNCVSMASTCTLVQLFTHRTPNPAQSKEYFPFLSMVQFKVVIAISKSQSPDYPADTTSTNLLLQQKNVSLCL